MSPKRFFPLAAALGAAALFFAYANSLHNAFSWDDRHVIADNVYIRSLSNIPRFFRDAYTFSSLPVHATWRPLVTLPYPLDYRLGHGLDPLQFHVTQTLLLLVTWAMLTLFLGKTLDLARPSPHNRWIALIAATVWAIHTVNTETLNLISARSEELAAIGTLAAFLLIQFSERAPRWHLSLLPIPLRAAAKAHTAIPATLLLVSPVP